MKLPNMALIFALIIIPITIVFSLYVGYQISTVTQQSTYDTRLVSATRDAITALEMNTFGDSTKDMASSTRRNIKASVNTFTNSFASNFGITGYDNNDVLSYVPALLFTMYDGYYIYAPTTDEQEIENAEDENMGNYILKPYIYYSARYKSDAYDVVINYSLDNYITITGTVGKGLKQEYISKSGYLIDTSTVKYDENISKVTAVGDVELKTETLYETISLPLEDYNMDGEITSKDVSVIGDDTVYSVIGGEKDPAIVTLKCKYCYKNNQKYYYYDGESAIKCTDKFQEGDMLNKVYTGKWFTYNATGRFHEVNAESIGITPDLLNDDSAINFYTEAYNFSEDIKKICNEKNIKITANTMVKPDGKSVSSLSDASDDYFIFKDDTTNVLDATGDKDAFTQHKLNVMQASITENLNVAMSNYSNAEVSNFYMPEMQETEWEKILTNISMVSFVQGMPIGFKTYNNYAVVTSTNNEMYVSENSIYYLINNDNKMETSDLYHHKSNCKTLTNEDDREEVIATGYASTDFDEYVISYTTEWLTSKNNKTVTETFEHYITYYRHHSLDCYNCIINNKTEDSDILKSAQTHAAARIKYNQYKTTRDVNNQYLEQSTEN